MNASIRLAVRITPSAHAHPAFVPPRASQAVRKYLAPRVCPTARPSIAQSFRRRWKQIAAPARAHLPRRRTNAVRATIAYPAARDDDAE